MSAPKDEKKIETVPPPEGEEDAYNAPTKVGEVNNEAWAKLIAENEQPPEKPATPADSSSRTKLPPHPEPAAPRPDPTSAEGLVTAPPVPEGPVEIPRLYANEEEEEDAATLLNPSMAPVAPAATATETVETLSDADLQSESGGPPPMPPPTSASAPTSGSAPTSEPIAPMGSLPPPMLPRSPSRMLTDPIPYLPGKIDTLLRPQPGRPDYLPWVIGVAALIGFVTLTVGVVMTLR